MKKDLYLFRHGQTEWNKLKRVQGTIDIELSSVGIKQAKNLIQYLRDKNLDVIYSSHLKRAWKTGEIVAKELKIEIIKNNHLYEVCWGDAQGKTVGEIKEQFGEEFDNRWSESNPDDDFMRFPNGESKIEVRERVLSAIGEFSVNSSYNSIGISTHGFVLKQMLIVCGNQNFHGLTNCEIVHIELETDMYKQNPYKSFKFIDRIKTN
jgi:2,3-bisphosphoglycerate-dependent phosphoglycerate mutase